MYEGNSTSIPGFGLHEVFGSGSPVSRIPGSPNFSQPARVLRIGDVAAVRRSTPSSASPADARGSGESRRAAAAPTRNQRCGNSSASCAGRRGCDAIRVAQTRDVLAYRRVEHGEERGDHRVVRRQVALGLRAAAQRLRQRMMRGAMQRRQHACANAALNSPMSANSGAPAQRDGVHQPRVVVQPRVLRDRRAPAARWRARRSAADRPEAGASSAVARVAVPHAAAPVRSSVGTRLRARRHRIRGARHRASRRYGSASSSRSMPSSSTPMEVRKIAESGASSSPRSNNVSARSADHRHCAADRRRPAAA